MPKWLRSMLVTCTVVLAGLAVMGGPSTAMATSVPTCSIHEVNIDGWSIQGDYVDTSWHFKCGNSFNTPWSLRTYLQWRDSAGAWHAFDCDNGSSCTRLAPSGGGTFQPGSEHSGSDRWNVAGAIDCHVIRQHISIVYQNFTTVNYNSPTTQIGGC